MAKLEGKVSIVTGAGFGFGEGIARKFAAEGSKVALVDINAENGERVTADLHPENTAIFIKGDVSKEEDWQNIVEKTLSAFGRIDVVVNNAGIVNAAASSLELAETEFDRLLRINTKSLFHSAKHVVPVFQKQGDGGVLLTISSISASRPRPKLVWYAASKAAASTATKGLAAELAADNIRCNAILPVAGDTAMLPLVMGRAMAANFYRQKDAPRFKTGHTTELAFISVGIVSTFALIYAYSATNKQRDRKIAAGELSKYTTEELSAQGDKAITWRYGL